MVVPAKLSLDALRLPEQDELIARTAKAAEDLLPRGPRTAAHTHLPDMYAFVHQVVGSARIRSAVLAIALVYIQRLKPCLPQGSRGDFDAPYRIFVAAVLTASKFLIDTGIRNETMSRATAGTFSPRDVSRAERTFLRLVNYRLWVEPEELVFTEECTSCPAMASMPIPVVVRAMRANAVDSETSSVVSSLSDTDSACEAMEEAMTPTVLPKHPVPLMLNRLA